MSQTQPNGASELQARLNDPHTLAALTRLLDRIDQLEQTVTLLSEAVEQGPAAVAMVTDTVDDMALLAADRGIDVDERLRSALGILEKLTEPRTVEALSALVERVDKLEQLVELANQAPGMVAMVTDTVDEVALMAADQGIDMDERLRNALAMVEKLTEPRTVNVLSALLERLDKLEQLVELADQAPGLIAMVTDTVDDTFGVAVQQGINLDERVRDSLVLLNKLTAPETTQALADIMEHMGLLQHAVDMGEQAPGFIAMAADMFDEFYTDGPGSNLNLEAFFRKGFPAAVKVAELMDSEEFTALLESGVLDPEAVRVMGSIGRAIAASQEQPPRRVSPWSLLRTLGDPDLQYALGFLVTFGREFGRSLRR